MALQDRPAARSCWRVTLVCCAADNPAIARSTEEAWEISAKYWRLSPTAPPGLHGPDALPPKSCREFTNLEFTRTTTRTDAPGRRAPRARLPRRPGAAGPRRRRRRHLRGRRTRR